MDLLDFFSEQQLFGSRSGFPISRYSSLPSHIRQSTYTTGSYKVSSIRTGQLTSPFFSLPPSLTVAMVAVPELGCYIIHSVTYPMQVIALTPSHTGAPHLPPRPFAYHRQKQERMDDSSKRRGPSILVVEQGLQGHHLPHTVWWLIISDDHGYFRQVPNIERIQRFTYWSG